MKHLRWVKFMHLLWVAYDHKDREVATGYINQSGVPDSWDNRDVFIGGEKVPRYEILTDVATELDVLFHARKKYHA